MRGSEAARGHTTEWIGRGETNNGNGLGRDVPPLCAINIEQAIVPQSVSFE